MPTFGLDLKKLQHRAHELGLVVFQTRGQYRVAYKLEKPTAQAREQQEATARYCETPEAAWDAMQDLYLRLPNVVAHKARGFFLHLESQY